MKVQNCTRIGIAACRVAACLAHAVPTAGLSVRPSLLRIGWCVVSSPKAWRGQQLCPVTLTVHRTALGRCGTRRNVVMQKQDPELRSNLILVIAGAPWWTHHPLRAG